jgi:hypothetical protein
MSELRRTPSQPKRTAVRFGDGSTVSDFATVGHEYDDDAGETVFGADATVHDDTELERTIGLIGGLIGVLAGLGLSTVAANIATRFTTVPVAASFSPSLIIGALCFSFTVGVLSGVTPARRAANLEPVEAVRYE